MDDKQIGELWDESIESQFDCDWDELSDDGRAQVIRFAKLLIEQRGSGDAAADMDLDSIVTEFCERVGVRVEVGGSAVVQTGDPAVQEAFAVKNSNKPVNPGKWRITLERVG